MDEQANDMMDNPTNELIDEQANDMIDELVITAVQELDLDIEDVITNETNEDPVIVTNDDEMDRVSLIVQIGLLLEYLSTKCIINLLTSSKDLLEFRGKCLLDTNHFIIIINNHNNHNRSDFGDS
jgi:hypothetical protein